MNHNSQKEQFLKRLTHLRKFSASGRKALHKPTLLLYALAEFKHRNADTIHYAAAEEVIGPILEKFGAPRSRALKETESGSFGWRTADSFSTLGGTRSPVPYVGMMSKRVLIPTR